MKDSVVNKFSFIEHRDKIVRHFFTNDYIIHYIELFPEYPRKEGFSTFLDQYEYYFNLVEENAPEGFISFCRFILDYNYYFESKHFKDKKSLFKHDTNLDVMGMLSLIYVDFERLGYDYELNHDTKEVTIVKK